MYALGAWFAVRFVVKRSIVLKTRADQLAFLTILVPLIGSVLFLIIPMFTGQTTGQAMDASSVGSSLVRFMLAFGLAYFIVRSYIQAYGDEAQAPLTA